MEFSETAFGPLPLPYLVVDPVAEAASAEAAGAEWLEIQSGKILVYLHGSGDRGNSAQEVMDGWGLLRLLSRTVRLPFQVIAPICPAEEIWRPEMVDGFLQALLKRFEHPKKIILAGFSLGGTGAMAYQAVHPGNIHGLVCVAGRVTAFDENNMAAVPNFVVYGSEDERLAQSDMANRFAKILDRGGNAILRILPGKGHYISDDAFALDELIDWLIRL
jgi:pimeloyl-ACP methyl ester carboxylesterase